MADDKVIVEFVGEDKGFQESITKYNDALIDSTRMEEIRQNAVTESLKATSQAWDDLFEDYKAIVDDWELENLRFEDSFTHLSTKAIQAITGISDAAEMKLSIVNGILGAGAEAWERYADKSESLERLHYAIENVKHSFGRFFDFLAEGFHALDPIFDAISAKLEGLADKVNYVFDKIAESQQEGGFLFDVVGGAFLPAGARDAIAERGAALDAAIEASNAKGDRNLQGSRPSPLVGTGLDAVNSVMGDVANFFVKTKEGLDKLEGQTTWADMFAKYYEDTKRQLERSRQADFLVNGLKDGVAGFVEGLFDAPDAVVGALQKAGQTAQSVAKTVGGGLETSTRFDSSIESAKSLVNRIQSSAASRGEDETQKKIERNTEMVAEKTEAVEIAVGKVAEQFGQVLANNPLIAVLK